jgi:hypothetical protein
MAKCNSAGASCGCSVVAGDGIKITGTGTASDPFVVTASLSQVSIADNIAVANSTTIELGKKGTGAVGDPVVLSAALTIRSPNGTRWSLAVSDAGVLTTIAAPAAPQGAPNNGGITVVANDVLYWDPTTSTWDTRTSSAHAIYSSLGSTNVPVPPGFKKGDTWLCEAT